MSNKVSFVVPQDLNVVLDNIPFCKLYLYENRIILLEGHDYSIYGRDHTTKKTFIVFNKFFSNLKIDLYWVDDDSLPANSICSHSFKEYVGFSEKYKYCVKCDHKKME